MRKRKVVQTELTEEEYGLLTSAAKERHLSIKAALAHAATEWSLATVDLSTDPLLRLKPVKFRRHVPADRIDAFLYRGE